MCWNFVRFWYFFACVFGIKNYIRKKKKILRKGIGHISKNYKRSEKNLRVLL